MFIMPRYRFRRIATMWLFALLTLSLAAQSARKDVFVLFNQPPQAAQLKRVQNAGGQITHQYWLVPAVAAQIPEQAIPALSQAPGIQRIEPDLKIYKTNFNYDRVWGVSRIKAPFAHNLQLLGQTVNVAVFDSGIDYLHPELKDVYAGGRDYINNDLDPKDDEGHGTHVSGTIAAYYTGNGVTGVAPRVNLFALKILGADGSGSYSNMVKALEWSILNGMQVINHSYGSSQDPGLTVQQAYDNAYDAGILHIASAGNSGRRNGRGNTVGYPARYESVVAIAATDIYDDRASFSSTGPDVELAAPGVNITSCRLGGGYVAYNGTSMAAPHVTGVVALLFQLGVPDTNGDGLIHTEIRERLQQTATDLGDPGRDTFYGFGLVNLKKAVTAGPVDAYPQLTVTDPVDGVYLPSGTTVTFTATATDNEDGDLTSAIVWTSSIDQALFTGGSFTYALSDGTHDISATVTDSAGQTATVNRTVNIGIEEPATPIASVTAVNLTTTGGRNSDKHLNVFIQVDDNTAAPVANATVNIELKRDGTLVATGNGITDVNGTLLFELKNATSGTYTVTVTSLTAPGYLWDGLTPPNSLTK